MAVISVDDSSPGLPGGTISLRLERTNFRLNLRTRSIDVLLETSARHIHIPDNKKRASLDSVDLCVTDEYNELHVESSSKYSPTLPTIAAVASSTINRQNSFASRSTFSVETINELPYSPRAESPEARPVERAVEARGSSEDGLGSMVRCLKFAETFIANCEYLVTN